MARQLETGATYRQRVCAPPSHYPRSIVQRACTILPMCPLRPTSPCLAILPCLACACPRRARLMQQDATLRRDGSPIRALRPPSTLPHRPCSDRSASSVIAQLLSLPLDRSAALTEALLAPRGARQVDACNVDVLCGLIDERRRCPCPPSRSGHPPHPPPRSGDHRPSTGPACGPSTGLRTLHRFADDQSSPHSTTRHLRLATPDVSTTPHGVQEAVLSHAPPPAACTPGCAPACAACSTPAQ